MANRKPAQTRTAPRKPGPRKASASKPRSTSAKSTAKPRPTRAKSTAKARPTRAKSTAKSRPTRAKSATKPRPTRAKPAAKKTATQTRTSSHRSGPSPHGTTRRRTAHGRPRPKPQPQKAGLGRRERAQRAKRVRQEADHRAITRRWWVIGAIALTMVSLVIVLEASFFEAKNTQVSGIARTSDGAVLDALDMQPDTALLRFDTTAAAERIAALPWIKQVEVTRQWPSTVRVVARERTASAAIGDETGSRWLVVSEDGVVVEERLTPPGSVPVIVASDDIVGAATVGSVPVGAERVLEIAYDLPLQLDPWITTWTTDGEGNVTANLVGSAVVEFGAFEDYRTQYVSLASILNGGAPLTCLRTIDLSVADNPVLQRDPQCMLESAEMTSN